MSRQQDGRVRVLAEIAARYHELVDPLNGPDGIRGTGELGPGTPSTYTPTVREFERLMALMRNQAKQRAHRGESVGTLRWHVLEWFLKAERVVRREPVYVISGGKRKQAKNADGEPAMRSVISYRRHRDAREQKAIWGIEWMAANWGLDTEPMLPEEIRVAA